MRISSLDLFPLEESLPYLLASRSAASVAKELGIDPTVLSQWGGTRPPKTIRTLARLVAILGYKAVLVPLDGDHVPPGDLDLGSEVASLVARVRLVEDNQDDSVAVVAALEARLRRVEALAGVRESEAAG